MPIKEGDKLPDVTMNELAGGKPGAVSLAEISKGKRIVVFAVPGAFTPTCSMKHLPGFVEQSAAIRAKGVDEIVCISINDPFVMKSWGDSLQCDGKVRMIGDWNGAFTKALGLDFDASGHGLGTRGKRFSMLVKDGNVAALHVEETPGAMDVSSAETMLKDL
jgi:peroxiredoxin